MRPYAHRYAYLPADPRWIQAWPRILDDARTIVEQVRRLGVVIAGPDGLRRPIFDPGMGVQFNGDASTDLAGDTFTVLAPLFTDPSVSAQAICRTGAKPYDLAVSALLLRCVQLVPDVFVLDSDGGWDSDWAIGHPEKMIDFGYRATHQMTLKAKQIVKTFYDRINIYIC